MTYTIPNPNCNCVTGAGPWRAYPVTAGLHRCEACGRAIPSDTRSC